MVQASASTVSGITFNRVAFAIVAHSKTKRRDDVDHGFQIRSLDQPFRWW